MSKGTCAPHENESDFLSLHLLALGITVSGLGLRVGYQFDSGRERHAASALSLAAFLLPSLHREKTVQNQYNALAFFAILCIMKVRQLVTYVSYITRDKEGTYAYTASRTQ